MQVWIRQNGLAKATLAESSDVSNWKGKLYQALPA